MRHDLEQALRARRAQAEIAAAPSEAPAARREATESSAVASDAQLQLRLQRGPQGYVAVALEHNAQLRAAFARFEAAVYRIAPASTLPDPTLSFGYFLRSVETRVGPQRARVSLQQSFPWPTKLLAGAESAAAAARAEHRSLDALSLALSERVQGAYYALWELRQIRALQREHLSILQALSESVQARVATGAATLADLQQVDLGAARLSDRLAGIDEQERRLEAQLLAVLGVPSTGTFPTEVAPPVPRLPAQGESELLTLVVEDHPLIAAPGLRAEAAEASARVVEADRLPSFSLGADWIITGEAAAAGVPESGKDAVVLGGGLRVPLFQGSYDDAAQAARAEASARRAEQDAQRDELAARLRAALSDVRDAVRRQGLYRDTLVPQAQSAYESVLGGYAVGQSNIAQVMLAQRELLELQLELQQVRSAYGRAWAALEASAGRKIAVTGDETEAAND